MPIRYDSDYVKRPNEEIEYTQEQIKELYECSKDIRYFIKYVKIIHPDKGEIFFEPYDYQDELLEKFMNNRFNIVLASRQSGKCSRDITKITIKNKNTGIIEDITIGDFFKKFQKK